MVPVRVRAGGMRSRFRLLLWPLTRRDMAGTGRASWQFLARPCIILQVNKQNEALETLHHAILHKRWKNQWPRLQCLFLAPVGAIVLPMHSTCVRGCRGICRVVGFWFKPESQAFLFRAIALP